MTFTDDDLKRLKDVIGKYEPRGYILNRTEWTALLARLEAAEDLMMVDPSVPEFEPLYEAWRKACGVK